MVFAGSKITGWIVLRDLSAFFLAYAAGALLLPRGLFLELLNGVLVTVSCTVCVLFFPRFASLVQYGVDGLSLMKFGIALAFADQMVQSVFRIYYIEFLPDVGGRTFDASLGAPAVGYIIAAACHVVSIGVDDDNRPMQRMVHAVAWSIAGGIAGVLALAGGHRLVGVQ